MFMVLNLSKVPPWLRAAILRYQGAVLRPEFAEELGKDFEVPPGLADLQVALDAETDRGCALLAAAVVDDRLSELLRDVFVDDPAVVKKLLEDRGSLGNFSSRIDVCFCLGLLPRAARDDLHLVRRIRNDFAHAPRSMTFDSEAMKSRVCCMRLCVEGDLAQDTRALFAQGTMGLLGVIEAAMANAKRADIPALDVAELRQCMREAHPKILAATQRVLDRKGKKHDGLLFRLSYRVGGALGRLAGGFSKGA